MMDSLWADTALPAFSPLERDAETDVLIIGGGLAGILCAYTLTQAGADCLLIEADTICGGISRNTTAKLTSQHGLLYGKLERLFGPDTPACTGRPMRRPCGVTGSWPEPFPATLRKSPPTSTLWTSRKR